MDKVTIFCAFQLSHTPFILSEWEIKVQGGRESGKFGRSVIVYGLSDEVCVLWQRGVWVCAQYLLERLKRKEEKQRWIYADHHFLSFTMFRSRILLQAFSTVFQRFPNPEKLKQHQLLTLIYASCSHPPSVFLCLFSFCIYFFLL